MHLDATAHTVELDRAGMRLDLGGIGKGYAADAALEVLGQHGITRTLVAAGGDIAVSAPPPGTDGWTIDIAPLEDPQGQPGRSLGLRRSGRLDLPGNAEQHVEINGQRYWRIVDPRTGLGLVGRASVTVVAQHGIDSNPWTKVVSVLGPKEGLEIIDAADGVAAFVVRKTPKGMETFASARFPKAIQKTAPESQRTHRRRNKPEPGPTHLAMFFCRMSLRFPLFRLW